MLSHFFSPVFRLHPFILLRLFSSFHSHLSPLYIHFSRIEFPCFCIYFYFILFCFVSFLFCFVFFFFVLFFAFFFIDFCYEIFVYTFLYYRLSVRLTKRSTSRIQAANRSAQPTIQPIKKITSLLFKKKISSKPKKTEFYHFYWNIIPY